LILSNGYIRPVKDELIALFEQNNQIYVTEKEATEMLRKQGHDHFQGSVHDNLFILTRVGFLAYDKDQYRFSLMSNAANVDFSIELPKRKHLEYKPRLHPPSNHCDKCKKELKYGDEFFLHSFANIQLCLCAECHEQKVLA
jgi:hypothetical protein